MKKDAYYFPHFSNARSDRKVQRLREELGLEGYGIFFMLLEVLRDQSDLRYPMTDIDLLAREFVTSEPKVRTVICNYNLFNVDEEQKFFSPKMIVYLQPYFEKRERARTASLKMHTKYEHNITLQNNEDANVEQMLSKCSASKVKQSKVKQSKEYLAGNTSPEVVKPETDLQKTVNAYFEVMGINRELWSGMYPRHVREAKLLLSLCKGSSDFSVAAIKQASVYFKQKNLSWTIGTVVKHFNNIGKDDLRDPLKAWAKENGVC